MVLAFGTLTARVTVLLVGLVGMVSSVVFLRTFSMGMDSNSSVRIPCRIASICPDAGRLREAPESAPSVDGWTHHDVQDVSASRRPCDPKPVRARLALRIAMCRARANQGRRCVEPKTDPLHILSTNHPLSQLYGLALKPYPAC